MNSSFSPAPRIFALGCALFALLPARLGAQDAPTATTATAPKENPEEFSRVRGLFDVDLPKTIEKFNMKLAVHPHFGDLIHRGYLRVPVGVRVGLNDRTEVSAEVE